MTSDIRRIKQQGYLSRKLIKMSNTTIASCVAGAAFLYLYHVNRAMVQVPEEVRRVSPHRWTVEEIQAAYEKAVDSPADMVGSIPPKQNRRYIVTGGSGMYHCRPT